MRKSEQRKVIITIVLVIVFTIILTFTIKDLVSSINKNNKQSATNNIVTLNGNNIEVFESQEDAKNNPITLGTDIISVVIAGEHPKLAATDGGFTNHIVSASDTEGHYTIDLTNIKNTVLAKVTIGDDSVVSRRLEKDVETYYFFIQPVTSSGEPIVTSNEPDGTVWVNGKSNNTYSSAEDAQKAISTRNDVSVSINPQVTASVNEATKRLFVNVSMVDGEHLSGSKEVCLAETNKWTASYDFSGYEGHQVTVCFRFESAYAEKNSYQYTSFWVKNNSEND